MEPPSAAPECQDVFTPTEPESFEDAGLTDCGVEALVLKYLLAHGDAAGRNIADQIKLPFILVHTLLQELKYQQLLGHRGAAPMNDFVYQLSDLGESGRGATCNIALTSVRHRFPCRITSPASGPSRLPPSIPPWRTCTAPSRTCC